MRFHRAGTRRVLGTVLGALLAAGAGAMALAVGNGSADAVTNSNPTTGAVFTTVNETVDGPDRCLNGSPGTNCNIYTGKNYVWLSGGPVAAALGDGDYFFAVLEPGGQGGNDNPNDGTPKNLSDDFDAYANRTFSVSNGVITYGGSHDIDSNKIRLMPYADTPNNGGVYILAVCSLADGYPVAPSTCKYDAFKVQEGNVDPGLPLTVTKDAAGAYDEAYTWTVSKTADRTLVKQVGGSATFTYTVTVTHDGGSVSNVTVAGTITVFNPNVDANDATVPVDIDGVSDALSDGTVCTITNGGAQTLTAIETTFAYVCELSALPTGELSNTVTVSWPEQFLGNGNLLSAGTDDFTFADVDFAATAIDECTNVTDSYAGTLGTVCVGDANPTAFSYSRTIPMPRYNCVSYDNTATFTTNDTGTSGSASQTVTVCGPAKTGALTMGFWQNRNGQKIINDGATTAGICKSGTWLRQYAPFQDLSATATCRSVATYVTTVIKAANASGAAMNAMLKAQMLATSLDVYFSDPSLGGNKIMAPAPIGAVAIDLTKVCTPAGTCATYADARSAFGGATSMTVNAALAYASSTSNAGGSTWYGQVKATQELAKNVFDAINNEKIFSA